MPRYTWIEKSLHQVDSEAERPLEEKETGDLHLSSLFILDSTGGGGVALELPVLATGKMGKVSPCLHSLQSERQKGILETGKGFSPERMYTEVKSSSVESNCWATAEWPLFYKLELWTVVWHVTVYADKLWIPNSRLIRSQLSEKPRALPIASCRRGQEEALRIWWAGGEIIGYL